MEIGFETLSHQPSLDRLGVGSAGRSSKRGSGGLLFLALAVVWPPLPEMLG